MNSSVPNFSNSIVCNRIQLERLRMSFSLENQPNCNEWNMYPQHNARMYVNFSTEQIEAIPSKEKKYSHR